MKFIALEDTEAELTPIDAMTLNEAIIIDVHGLDEIHRLNEAEDLPAGSRKRPGICRIIYSSSAERTFHRVPGFVLVHCN